MLAINDGDALHDAESKADGAAFRWGAAWPPSLPFADYVHRVYARDAKGNVVEKPAAGKQKAGRYLVGRRAEKGRPTRELLGKALIEVCEKIPFKKSMRWGTSDVTFGRPVQWLVALFGEAHAPASSRATLRRMGLSLSADIATGSLPPDAPMSRNAQFVWFGDFLSPLPAIETALRRLAQAGAGGYLVHIVDPAEEDFPYEGRTRFEAPGDDLRETLGRAELVAPAYRARFKAHAQTVALLAGKLGWSYLSHRTDRPPQTALIALYAEMSGAQGYRR